MQLDQVHRVDLTGVQFQSSRPSFAKSPSSYPAAGLLVGIRAFLIAPRQLYQVCFRAARSARSPPPSFVFGRLAE
jgi:hypothetical protein